MITTEIKPFLKWAGGKYRLRTAICQYLPAGKRFIEPFVGSGAIFLNTNYQRYLLADQNEDLIALYHFLKTGGDPFIEFCRQFFVEKNNNAKRFYALRDNFNRTTDQRLRAALFLYLNRHGYNGLCRYNTQGYFNVPFGRYLKVSFPEIKMRTFRQKLKHADLLCADFITTLKKSRANDVIYCDPPYIPLSETASFTQYHLQKFSIDNQLALAQLARQVVKKGVTVIISNHDTPLAREIYQGADIFSFPVRRTISCNAEKRLPAKEILAIYTPEKIA